MSDKQKGRTKHEATDPSDEAAAAKLWAVYISEAEKYDKSLVESWKNDMKGMLIFAGLFFASLTAFLMESYKTLSPDSGDQTVRLLTQISQQLASGCNGTAAVSISPSPAFTPSPTSLFCNALWFISLGLSLTCALVATLVEQWARDFIHKADMRSAPLIRARIYSYLYYGMRRFNMHAVVETIPLLLHASLLFFFAGLVFFLIPVSTIMAAIAAAFLTLVNTMYYILTFLPLLYMDCPYRTPLSGAYWRMLQRMRIVWASRLLHTDSAMETDQFKNKTMVEVMTRSATGDSPARRDRDYRALVWTVKSLADDIELETFVDALPDALWGPRGERKTYCDHIRRLANRRDVHLCSRIDGLYTSTLEGNLSPEAGLRRRIACYKALWAVASVARPVSSQTQDSELPVAFDRFWAYRFGAVNPSRPSRMYTLPAPERPFHYVISAEAMMKWSTFCAISVALQQHQLYLAHCQTSCTSCTDDHKPPLMPTPSFLAFVGWHCGFFPHLSIPSRPAEQLAFVRRLPDIIPHTILFQYLNSSADLDSPPYQWDETLATIRIASSIPYIAVQEELVYSLNDIERLDYSALEPGFLWKDTVVAQLCSFWKPMASVAIPTGIIHYLSRRGSDSAVSQFLERSGIGDYAWHCVPPTISLHGYGDKSRRADLISSFWTLAAHGLCGPLRNPHTTKAIGCYVEALEAMSSREYYISTIALIKMAILKEVHSTMHLRIDIIEEDFRALVSRGIFPSGTERSKHDRSRLSEDIMDAKLGLLAEFLQHCSSTTEMPYRAIETLNLLIDKGLEFGSFRPARKSSYQTRFVESVQALLATARSRELLNVIVRSQLLDGYSGVQGDRRGKKHYAWISEPIARQKLTEAFTTYESTLSADADSPQDLLDCLQDILLGLETVHLNPDPESKVAAAARDTDGPDITETSLPNAEIADGIGQSP